MVATRLPGERELYHIPMACVTAKCFSGVHRARETLDQLQSGRARTRTCIAAARYVHAAMMSTSWGSTLNITISTVSYAAQKGGAGGMSQEMKRMS